ncbi:hypothetical protein [Embleya sp. NBC_00896]|uniref:hypothetical protein n=1 Tax=Embleya sp. NBC_00896 TaxID=2975961 RepID=UPI002F90666F|nr:hypothetical protein OG928_44520 [Embleya sp. NBC_00896]
MRKRMGALATAALIALAGTAACGTHDKQKGPASGTQTEILSGSPLIPATDVVDTVSYADHVLVVTVTAERELPADQEIKRGEGMIMREVTLNVDETLWSRPGAAQAAPRSIKSNAAGWVLRKNERTPFATQGDSRLEVGNTYIMAVYRLQERGYAADDWMPFVTLPYNDKQIGHGEQTGGKPRPAGVLSKTEGQSAAALSALLTATQPDPISTKYLHLDGAARYRATAAEKHPVAPR